MAATGGKKKVIVIGGGFGGAMAANKLDLKPDLIELTLITKRENFMLMKYGGLRAAVANGNWIPRALVPLTKLMKQGKLSHGTVVSIDPAGKTVTLEDGQSLPWDILLIASGSRNFSPAEPPLSVTTKEGTHAYYTQMHAALAATKNVVIVGSGPVGIEIAGELKAFGQANVKITLVTRSKTLLPGPKLTKSNLQSLASLLKKEQVEVVYEDEVVSEPFPKDLSSDVPIVQTPNGVRLKSGKEIKCDLLVYTTGSNVNTSFIPKEWLDAKTGEVVVDEKTLKLAIRDDVFCVGDAAKTNYTKLGYIATEDGKIVAANIIQACEGKKPSKQVSRPSAMMLVPFGPSKGRVMLPFITLGNYMASTLKGAGLFAKMTWGTYAPGLTPPAPKA
jgi:NADH dehydrogenase FAD-containing subunit